MVNIELNGFDESGIIGGKLRFVQIGMSSICELRPFVYNLLHFGSLTASKSTIRGQLNEKKLEYFRAILADQNIDVTCYDMPIDVQLELIRYFTIGEFCKIANIREHKLINAYNEADETESKTLLRTAIYKLRKYTYPHKYIESYLKSFAYRMIFENIQEKSRLYKNSKSKDIKLMIFVDGGHPFTFWKDEFLSKKESTGTFQHDAISINGVSNGDEYFPLINIAGNIATIINYVPQAIYPHNIIEIPKIEEEIKGEFYQNFSTIYDKPSFSQRILFFGDIDRDLQYSLPFLIYRENNIIYEPFRMKGTIKSFYKAFKGDSSKDLVIYGKQRKNSDDESKYKECEEYGLDKVNCDSYKGKFNELLNDVFNEAKFSNLDTVNIQKIDSRINRIKERVNLSQK